MTPQVYQAMTKTRVFLKHHHPVIFICIIGILLGFSIFSLYEVLSLTFLNPDNLQSAIQPFDKSTVTTIEQLHVATESGNDSLTFPSPRVNPFVE